MNRDAMVSLISCKDYEETLLVKKISDALLPLGGIEAFVKPGNRVLLKPNLIIMKKPEAAVTTHPLFVKAVVKLVEEAGGIATVADSPGGLYGEKVLEQVYRLCGLKQALKDTNASLNYNVKSKTVQFEENGNHRVAKVIDPVFSADVIINLPKLKTHVMSGFTGGVKNLFGLIPGLEKANYHFQYSEKEAFFSYITDFCCYIKPSLTIADGINILEGDGPTNGIPRSLGLILASENPFNLDLIAHSIFGFSQQDILTSRIGGELGLCPTGVETVPVYGEDYRAYLISDLKKPKAQSTTFDKQIPPFLQKYVKKFLNPYPKFKKSKCIRCKNCITICPAKILKLEDGRPVFVDRKKCIRCYCCHEMCPNHAVKVQRFPF